MAAIPREDIAKLIERCWAAAFEDGKRMSTVLGRLIRIARERDELDYTWTPFVDLDGPTHFGEGDGCEASYRPSADNDGLAS